MKIRYIDRLLAHPGLIFPIVFTVYGILAGGFSSNVPSFAFGATVGALVCGLPMWAIVLWTARTQPVDGE
jgi:membrane associated rhomboid family serine protease